MHLSAQRDDAAPRFNVQMPQIGDMLAEEVVHHSQAQVSIGAFERGVSQEHQ
jgi:hypothetical protein